MVWLCEFMQQCCPTFFVACDCYTDVGEVPQRQGKAQRR
jgi:hypothetical protein